MILVSCSDGWAPWVLGRFFDLATLSRFGFPMMGLEVDPSWSPVGPPAFFLQTASGNRKGPQRSGIWRSSVFRRAHDCASMEPSTEFLQGRFQKSRPIPTAPALLLQDLSHLDLGIKIIPCTPGDTSYGQAGPRGGLQTAWFCELLEIC